MKYGILITILSLTSTILLAQVEPDTSYWKNSLNLGIYFNQASFSDNWTGGGVSSIAIGSSMIGKANYKKEKITWTNLLEFGYGVVKNQGQTSRKTTDLILLDSKFGLAVSDHWNMFGSLNFLSQFDQGFRFEEDGSGVEQRVLISKFMAPGFLTTSLGMEYLPNEYFTVRLSPFSPRLTFVTDSEIINNVPENYGVDPGETVRYEWLAAQIVAKYNRDFSENLSFDSRYMMFANYEELSFEQIDHRLELALSAKVTKFINTSFRSILLYDQDQADGIQISQMLAIGVLFNLGYQEEKK